MLVGSVCEASKRMAHLVEEDVGRVGESEVLDVLQVALLNQNLV